MQPQIWMYRSERVNIWADKYKYIVLSFLNNKYVAIFKKMLMKLLGSIQSYIYTNCLKTHLIKLINFKKSRRFGTSYIPLFKGHTGGHKMETQWEFVTNIRLFQRPIRNLYLGHVIASWAYICYDFPLCFHFMTTSVTLE